MASRFNQLKGQLAGQKGVTNPGALAATIGRKKYGAQAFNSAAAKGMSPADNQTVKAVVAGRKKRKKRKITLPAY